MRILYNHALSASELYTGIQDEMTDKSLDWLQANMDFLNHSGQDYLGHILVRTMDVIIQKIINDKQRFISPHNYFYIDFEIFQEEDFKVHRQRGRMQDIDVIDSGFTGYQLTLFYKNKNSVEFYKKRNIYLGGRHREMFIDKINNGEKMYSITDFQLGDVIKEIHSYFPRMTLREITRIANRGLIRIYQALRYGCYVALSTQYNLTTMFIGGIYKDISKQWKDYSRRMIKKQQRIYKWDTPEFNGWYYIEIPKRYMQDWYEMNNKSSRAGWKWVWFRNKMARRLFESTLYASEHTYIFRVKLQKKYSKGWTHFIEGDQKYREVDFVGEAINFKFKPADKHWKDLIKEYNEERNS